MVSVFVFDDFFINLCGCLWWVIWSFKGLDFLSVSLSLCHLAVFLEVL